VVVYFDQVTALKAHVVNGKIVVDEPADLPDGSEVRVYLYDAAAEGMSAQERTALEQRLQRSIAQVEHVKASELTSTWSRDGESVGLVRGDEIICMIVAAAQKGHSRALGKQGPLGLPFDEVLAEKTFPARKR
jgi:hypothetical protein